VTDRLAVLVAPDVPHRPSVRAVKMRTRVMVSAFPLTLLKLLVTLPEDCLEARADPLGVFGVHFTRLPTLLSTRTVLCLS